MKIRQSVRPRIRQFAITVGAVSLLAAACGSESSSTASSGSNGVYELAAPTVEGGQLDFGSLEGKDTVLWFWAPW